MCRSPSSGRVRGRACGLPFPASGWRSRHAARLRFDRCATAAETRPLPAVSRSHPPATSTDCPAVSDGRGEAVIPRPVVRGQMAVALPRSRSPVPSPLTVLSAQLPAMLIVRRRDGVPSSACLLYTSPSPRD